jgi:CRP-like cAMP-binding protein
LSIARTIQSLRRTRLFGRLGSDRLNVLAFSGERIEFDQGDILLVEGEEERAAFVVLEGMVEAGGGADDDARVRRRCAPGAVFGEYCLLVGRPSNVSVTALSRGAALKIDHTLIERMIDEFPDFAVYLRDLMAARIIELGDRLRALESSLKGTPRSRPRSAPPPEHGRRSAPSPASRR